MATEGAITKAVFEAYVEHFLALALEEGQVVLDNLQAQRASGCGCWWKRKVRV